MISQPNQVAQLLLLLLLACSVAALQQQQQQQQPQELAPEPYSFSYTADSQGGQSSHQESGDGSGRVAGFYTIRGDDGRERRVDYVADENGYRATVKTNEVGTRAVSSADAQYEVELPSQGQLDAAKVSLDEYKYLEDVHAMERTRSGRTWQQNQAQQQLARNRQPTSADNNLPSSENQASGQQSLSNTFVNQNRQTTGGRYSTSSAENSANVDFYAGSSGSSQDRALRQANGNQYATSFYAANNQSSNNQLPLYSNSQASSKFQTSSIGQSSLVASQQRPKNTWLSGDRPTSKPTFLQQQLEQQFMAQANQLTNQDYPRQIGYSVMATGQQSRTGYTESVQPAVPKQQPIWSGGSSLSESSAGRITTYEQAVNNNGITTMNQQLGEINGQQIIQQQSSAINESDYQVVGEELAPEDGPMPIYRPQSQPQSTTTGSLWNTTPSPLGYNNQTVPSGFMAINLSEEPEEVSQTEKPQTPQQTISFSRQPQQPQIQIQPQPQQQPQPQRPQQLPQQQQIMQQQDEYQQEPQQQQKQPEMPQQQPQEIQRERQQPQQLPQLPQQQQQQQQQDSRKTELDLSEGPQIVAVEQQQQQQPRLPAPQQQVEKQQQQNIFREEQRQPQIIVSQNLEPIQRRPDSIKQIISSVTRQPVITSAPYDERQQNQAKQQEVLVMNQVQSIDQGQRVQTIVGGSRQISTRPTFVVSTTTTTTTTPTYNTDSDQVEITTTREPQRITFQPTTTTTTTTRAPTTSTTTTMAPTTRASVATVGPTYIDQTRSQQPAVAGVKGGKSSGKYAPQWMRPLSKNRVTSDAQSIGNFQAQPVKQQQATYSITPEPTKSPMNVVKFEPVLDRNREQASTSRPNFRPQVDFDLNTTKRPEQPNNRPQYVDQAQQQQAQNNSMASVLNSKPAPVTGTKGGFSKKSKNSRQFWTNSGSQVTYATQGTNNINVPIRTDDSSYYGNRVSTGRIAIN